MGVLDIILLALGLSAGVGGFLGGSDSLYKLFLGLIIGFLSYLVISYQVVITTFLSPALLDGYQVFLSKHSIGILSLALLSIPILGVFFMLHPRLTIESRPKSISHILLGLLLPIFLIGILSHLAEGSVLSDNATWRKIFTFFEGSGLYQIFQKLPWGIFLLLGFLIFYKSIFLLLAAFFIWLWKDVIFLYFQDWKKSHKKTDSGEESEGGRE